MTDEFPHAVKVRACELANAERMHNFAWTDRHVAENSSLTALARLIMKYEPGLAVDPLEAEANEICAQYFDSINVPGVAQSYRAGEYNAKDDNEKQVALAALRRGIELGREGGS